MNKGIVLLVGAGRMGVEYARVLGALNKEFITVGRGVSSAAVFKEKTGFTAVTGGVELWLSGNDRVPEAAIIAVNVTDLASTCHLLLDRGVKRILLEKPGSLTIEEITSLNEKACRCAAEVYIAYNRRFMPSVIHAAAMLHADGGVTSFHFEFTEWSDRIEVFDAHPAEKERWFLSNSSHVADLAFFLGGAPERLEAFTAGSLPWHPSSSVFTGAGVTTGGVPFSYCANWDAPGRWGVEIMSRNFRVILKPLEELHIQKRGSVAVEKIEIPAGEGDAFKPGLYKMVSEFLRGDGDNLCSLGDQTAMFGMWCRMADYR